MEKCKAIMVFGDDYGDNDCTFHCQLPEGHEGEHVKIGNMYRKFPYFIQWSNDMRSFEEE